MDGGGGIGAMLQSHIAEGSEKGGVGSIINVVKGLDTNTLDPANIAAVGQIFGGAFGLKDAAMAGLNNLKTIIFDVGSEAKSFLSDTAAALEEIMKVMKVEGVTPPEYTSPGAIYAPDSSPVIGQGVGVGVAPAG